MKKLDDIPKGDIFKTPDSYFDKLPGIIQSRIAKEGARRAHGVMYYSLRYALPAVAVIVTIVLWLTPQNRNTAAENILASVATRDLVAYLHDDELTLDELLEQIPLDEEDATKIQQSVYSLDAADSTNLDSILDEIIDIDPNSL